MIKELEALEIINNMLYGVEEFEFINLEMVLTRDLEKVKQTLLKAQEQEKVLKIIDEKNVDILDIKVFENYKHYCRAMEDSGLRKDWWLTEEEFNTLKEYFK